MNIKALLISALATIFGCTAQQQQSANDRILEPEEYIKALEADNEACLIDVRRAEEYAAGHLPGAMLLDVTDSAGFSQGMEKLDKEKNIYIYCRSGRRSRTAADILVKKGFKVYNLDKGILNWIEEGREIEK